MEKVFQKKEKEFTEFERGFVDLICPPDQFEYEVKVFIKIEDEYTLYESHWFFKDGEYGSTWLTYINNETKEIDSRTYYRSIRNENY
jgi:hypothetical protein